VVTDGLQKISDGMQVRMKRAPAEPNHAAAPTSPGSSTNSARQG
jgi:hypothetical protein